MTTPRRVRYLVRPVDERLGLRDLPLLSVSATRGVIHRADITDSGARAEDLSNYKVCHPGDIVVNRMSAYQGALGMSRWQGIVSPDYIVFRPDSGVESRWLHHTMRSAWFISEMTRRLRGIGSVGTANVRTPRVSVEEIGEIRLQLPTLTTQRAIADYLDTETARIDALVAKKLALSGLAHERLRAFITTLTSDGPLVRVRHVTSVRTSGPRGWADLVGDRGAPFIRSANLQRQSIKLRTDNLAAVDAPATPEAERSRVRSGDVLIGITGANTGWVGLPNEEQGGGFVSQHVAVLRPSRVVPAWLAYCLFSSSAQDQLLGGQYGGTKQQLGLDDLAELAIALPSRSEQESRIVRLEAATARTEALVDSLHRQLALLIEHRQALVTAAVTGELEVPGMAA